ncbi:MAG TPA: tRNA epoxyqueuosine(34) reductase QueG [Longimicrobium sp.]|nr:tRNA epoxyqueuosine(34) reductase QueG [Longimicrobium sp.]
MPSPVPLPVFPAPTGDTRARRQAAALSARIRLHAREMGFDAVGIAPVHPSEHGDAYDRWLALGMHGEMGYLSREDAVEKRHDPAVLVPGAKSAVVVALHYDPRGASGDEGVDASRGIVARYARNDDYHELMKERLIALQEWIAAELLPVSGRAYVDTGAVLEREVAQRAGLGWQGRNTMLIHPRRGSYFFIGEVLLDVELEYDDAAVRDHCGTCQRCLDACPTGALLGRDASGAPVMDARRCISYLTIELRGPIPRDLRPLIGNRVYGCDICQEVCPWNRFSRPTHEAAFLAREGLDGPSLVEWMTMTQEEFSRRFKNSPIKRTKRRGLLRNVAVALGNWGSAEAVPALAIALNDEEPLVRGHAAWALGSVASRAGVAPSVVSSIGGALTERLVVEEDDWVRDEIACALAV